MKRLALTSIILALLAAVPVHAQASKGLAKGLKQVKELLFSVFEELFNVDVDSEGFGIFIKLLITVGVFAIFYWQLEKRLDGKKGVAFLISFGFALLAGFGIDWELAIKTSRLFANLIMTIIVLIPFLVLGNVTWKECFRNKSAGYGDTLLYAVGWFLLIILFTFFIDDIQNLKDASTEWLTAMSGIILFLSIIIFFALLIVPALRGKTSIGSKGKNKSSKSDGPSDAEKSNIADQVKELRDVLRGDIRKILRDAHKETDLVDKQDILAEGARILDEAVSAAAKISDELYDYSAEGLSSKAIQHIISKSNEVDMLLGHYEQLIVALSNETDPVVINNRVKRDGAAQKELDKLLKVIHELLTRLK